MRANENGASEYPDQPCRASVKAAFFWYIARHDRLTQSSVGSASCGPRGTHVIALGLREFHQFHAAGRQFLYLVPSAAVFELDPVAEAVLRLLREAPRSEETLIEALNDRFPADAVKAVVSELRDVRAIGHQQQPE